MFSYYQNQESLAPPKTEVRRKQGRLRLVHLPSLVAVVIIVASVIYSLTLSYNPKVIVVNEKDQAVQSLLRTNKTYEDAMLKSMKRSVLSRTKLTINPDKLIGELKEQFPELLDVSVTIPLLSRRPIAYVQITKPDILLSNAKGSFVVDDQGRVIMDASQLAKPDQLQLLSVSDQTGVEARVNERILPKDYVAFIDTVASQTTAKGLKKPNFTLPPLAHELHARFEGLNYAVKFSLEGDSRQQVGTFLALKQKLDTDKVTPAAYVDVRIDERAYYR